MAEASQNREAFVNDFSPGWVLKRGTATSPNGPLFLCNIATDEDGSMIARNGVIRINSQKLTDGSSTVNASVVHSHFLSGSTRYIGVGTVVKRNFDPGINIITGLSGARLTAAQMSPSTATPEMWTYFANGNGTIHGTTGDCRRKDNGTVTRNWGIEGPALAPTVALVNHKPQNYLIEDFASSYAPQDGVGSSAGAATGPYETSGQTFTVTLTKSDRFRRSNALDLSKLDETAFVRAMVRVSRTEDVDHLELAFDVDDGTFTKDYYAASIPISEFPHDNTWTEIRVRKSDFTRVAPTGGSTKTWANVSAVQITVATIDTQTSGTVKISFDDMRMEEDSHADGVVDYKLTFWNNDLKIRSNSRTLANVYAGRECISDPINASRQGVTVTRVSSTSDVQVTHWEVWRRNQNGAGIFQFVDRVPIGLTTYKDYKGDLELGEELIEDNHIPPPARFVIEWDDRLFLFGMKSDIALSPTVFRGDGPDNLTTSGTFTGSSTDYRKWVVEIDLANDSEGTPDTFKWSDNNGQSFTTGITITGANQHLSMGIFVKFAKIGKHKLGDRWEFQVDPVGEEQSEYTVRFSPRFRPESYPITNYFLAGDPKNTITGGTVWRGQLWIFTKKNIYQVAQSGNSYIAVPTEASIGTESPYAISPSPYGIFYYAPKDGPQLFNGSTTLPIARQSIQPFFDGEVINTDGVSIPVATPVFIKDYRNVVGQYHEGNYTLVIDDSGGDCRVIIYNAERQRWSRWGGKELTLQRLASEKAGNDIVPANNLEAGNADGWLLLLSPVVNNPIDPGGEAIEVMLQHTFDVIMKPQDVEVDVKDIVLDIDTGGQAVLVEASFDDAPMEIIGADMPIGRTKVFFPVPGVDGAEAEGRICYKISVRMVVQQRTSRVKLFGIGVNYWPEPRRSTAYSAMWFAPKEKGWARRGRFVMRTYAPVRVQLIFDETNSYEFTLPNTQGKRLGQNPTVPTAMHGKVARIIFDSSDPFVVYPQSYFEMYPFGEPTRLIPWQLTP